MSSCSAIVCAARWATTQTRSSRSETEIDELPHAAIARMGMRPGQKNALLRVVLRDLTETLTHEHANELRDRIYVALHEGDRAELAVKRE